MGTLYSPLHAPDTAIGLKGAINCLWRLGHDRSSVGEDTQAMEQHMVVIRVRYKR